MSTVKQEALRCLRCKKPQCALNCPVETPVPQVMELFLRSPRTILSADKIMERVWGWDSDAEINVVWVHISNLRKKLAALGSGVVIRANRGLGYSLETQS